MATIKARGKGYSIIVDVGTDADGKRKQKRFTVRGSRADAEKKLRELLRSVDNGTYTDAGKLTLSQYLERWLREYATPSLSPRTTEGYESIIRQHLIPKLGRIPLANLKPEHIQQFYADCLSSGRSDGTGGLNALTVRHFAMCLHRALTHAEKWGLLPRNPADAVDVPRYQRAEMRIMSEPDIEKLLDTARDTTYFPVFYMALFTGMRRSEYLALKWGDIDLILGQVSVTRSIHRLKRDNSLIFRSTKTAKGRRTIALTPSTTMVLRAYKEKQEALKMSLCNEPLADSDLVFCQPNGTPLLPDTVSHAWTKLTERIGLKGVRLHDARHTHASLMLKQGIHPKVVQERLGHATISTTLDIYSHVTPGLQQVAAQRFDEALNIGYNKQAENGCDQNVTISEKGTGKSP